MMLSTLRVKLVTLCAALLLAGCGETHIIDRPVPVEVPVGVPCKVPGVPAPQWATDGITVKNSLFEQVKALATTNEQRKAYEASLIAANQACQ